MLTVHYSLWRSPVMGDLNTQVGRLVDALAYLVPHMGDKTIHGPVEYECYSNDVNWAKAALNDALNAMGPRKEK